MSFDTELVVSAIISLIVITSPFDAVKVLFFNSAIAQTGANRTAAALRVSLYVGLVIAFIALVGQQLLRMLGIELDAFRVVGGLLIAAMGFEMLYGGGGTGPQGSEARDDGPTERDTLVIPLTMPLIAGPGAVTTTIAITSQGDNYQGTLAALIGAGVVAVVTFVSFAWLGEVITRIRPNTMALVTRLGGLVLATIGVQMLLTGLRDFFA